MSRMVFHFIYFVYIHLGKYKVYVLGRSHYENIEVEIIVMYMIIIFYNCKLIFHLIFNKKVHKVR